MEHQIFRITDVEVINSFVLRVEFDDQSSQTINLEPILRGQVYGPLTDPNLFAKVQIDEEVGTISWPNGADFDPSILHDWPRYESNFIKLAESWEQDSQNSGISA